MTVAATARPERGWTSEWTHTGFGRRVSALEAEAYLQRARTTPPAFTVPTGAPCSTCWGQRRIYEAAGNGEGLVPVPCPDCWEAA